MTTLADVDPELVDMMGQVFAAHRDAQPPGIVVERDAPLWSRLDDLGLIRLTGPEESGGSGAGWYEAVELIGASARNGVRVPLAEHDLLACWLLEAVGLPAGDHVRTICVLDDRGAAASVPWAALADRIVVVWQSGGEYQTADIARGSLSITPGTNLIGEPRDTVLVDTDRLAGVPIPAGLVAQLRLKSAIVRSVQVCAALDRILELSVEHAKSRLQFGRPLARFQAVQNLVADIAAESALARAATEAALHLAVSSQWSAPRLDFRVAVARSCTGHAASVAVRNAHQVHGAIGTTREHRLHEFTRALLPGGRSTGPCATGMTRWSAWLSVWGTPGSGIWSPPDAATPPALIDSRLT